MGTHTLTGESILAISSARFGSGTFAGTDLELIDYSTHIQRSAENPVMDHRASQSSVVKLHSPAY